MIPKIEEQQQTGATITYAPVYKVKRENGVIDGFLTALLVVIVMALISTFFVRFNVDAELDVKNATTETFWLAVGTFCVGSLSKRIARRKGEKTEAYRKAQEEANKAIGELNQSKHASRAGEYGKACTDEIVKRQRLHYLTMSGLSYEEYQLNYFGKGVRTLRTALKEKKISFLQLKAVWKCNRLKVQSYNISFITSYSADIDSRQVPSAQHNVKSADRRDSLRSLGTTIGSAFGLGFVFSDVILNFSVAVLFAAIIKLIVIGIIIGMKASFGWNLSVMETQRNMLRASEARACIDWAERNPVEG